MPVPERPVLVAPRAFRGTLRAAQVAGAVGRGLERAGLMPPDLCPVADGGPGTLEALLPRLGGEVLGAEVHESAGRPVRAGFALVEDGGTAIVEALASTRATGELIAAALASGARVVVVAAGGSLATDGGAGAIEAIEAAGGLGGARLVALWTGAAGGLPRGLAAAFGATLERGVPWVLDALDFDARMRASRAVVTGEGRLDDQTLEGKLVGEIGTRARQAGVPLHAIVGSDAMAPFAKRMIDLQWVRAASTLEELEAAGEELGSALSEGRA
jgi:glycerate 2-kinase